MSASEGKERGVKNMTFADDLVIYKSKMNSMPIFILIGSLHGLKPIIKPD